MDNDPDALNDLLDRAGHATALALFSQVDPLFRGRSLAIELGIGVDAVILGHARTFDRVRGVDADAAVLTLFEARAARQGITTAQAFRLDDAWDEPTGSADYVFARDLFVRTVDWVEAANYLQRTSMVLRRGGIAQLRFDTRVPTLADKLRQRLPSAGNGPVRRLESWVRDRVRGADLEIIGERGPGTAEHWVVARRR
ncbi:MAG TPA: class I SAM-dependent methyltransferase [Candidatus Dormibacteraeota bacterium]|nr:class I SAM-dependent methyltransferase [Candidatus Dormibacteraeota bacterium]